MNEKFCGLVASFALCSAAAAMAAQPVQPLLSLAQEERPALLDTLEAPGPVIEGFGLRGFGSHTQNAEDILVSSIEPRLYLAARMIMDISTGKAPGG